MQIVIDIDEEIYKDAKEHMNCEWRSIIAIHNALNNCTVLPNNATNGDVIKTVFSDGRYGTNGNYVHVFGVGGNGVWTFTKDWWNAPYKAGDTDE